MFEIYENIKAAVMWISFVWRLCNEYKESNRCHY